MQKLTHLLLRRAKLRRLLTDNEIKVNLGCGNNIQEGYINIDTRLLPGIHISADADWCFRNMSNCCDEVYMSHVLEHFAYPGKDLRENNGSVLWVLKQVMGMLKKGGVIRIAVPDFRALAELYFKKNFSLFPRISGRICGEQNYPENQHKTVFDEDYLTWCLEYTGFKSITKWSPHGILKNRDASFDEIDGKITSLNLIAKKL